MSLHDIDYMRASLKASLELRSKLISFHQGEKGRFNENQIQKVLRRLLPKKMDIGTGFIACSDANRSISAQQDIVIYDSLENVTLFHDEMFDIFPIESVYGTIEVKTTLNVSELEKSFTANRKMRDMAENTGKYYRVSVAKERVSGSGEFVTEYFEVRDTLSPRFFMFCYSCDWINFETLKKNFEDLSTRTGAHCHGLCVLEKDWFICRNPYDKNEYKQPEISFSRDANGFSIFCSRVSTALTSMKVYQANLDRYEKEKFEIITATDSAGVGIPLSNERLDIFGEKTDP